MIKRTQPMILFMTIGMLLAAKAGFTIWQTNADELVQTTAKQNLPAQSSVPNIAKRQPELLSTPPKANTSASPGDSWAMLEAYLIPEAKAASATPAPASFIEDKTLTSLRQYRNELEQRSKKLDLREQSLQKAEAQMKRRITELEQLEASIGQRLSDEAKIKNKKIKRLTAVYEGMKADRAAPVIAKMDLAIVVKIFLLMDEKKVGKILSFLPPDKAVTISQALTRQISSVK